MQLQQAISQAVGAAPDNIQGLFLVSDPATGKVVIQFDVVPSAGGGGMSTDDIVQMLSKKVSSPTFYITDMYRNKITTNCYDIPRPSMFPWTDYGPCPYQRCMNGGRCNVKVTGQYYCECKSPYRGKMCEEMGEEKPPTNNNLLWLLLIPAAVLLLSLLLCCCCCWSRQCCCFGGGPGNVVKVIEEDVYQDVDTRSLRSVRSVRSCASQPSLYSVSGAPMMTNDPGSSYYHALGRPFAVAFNDNTFSAVGYATNDAGLYNSTGCKRGHSLCGDEEITVVMNGGGSCCGSGYGGAGMGNRYVSAYNDRTFNTYSSMPRYDRMRCYN